MTPRIRHSGKVFRDPIHKLIRIDREDEFLLQLIDTPEFQRLRRIRQLGVSWLTYPGAEHSRFVHSLGVFNFVQRMIEVLRRRYAENEVGDYLEKHGKLAKAAALLHDIGHGPFSHMIERAFDVKSNHEDKTVALIKDPSGSISGILRNAGIDPEEVAGLINHAIPHPLLIDLVTSQLDADRMDYLLRDSYCTGVQYGVFDAEWLLNAMCVGMNPLKIEGEGQHRSWRLALDERRGEKAAEQFILARSHMSFQVYFHRATRGFETLLLRIFQLAALAAKGRELPRSTPAVVLEFFAHDGELSRDQWLQFDESVVIAALHVWSNDPQVSRELSRLSTAFLRRERVLCSVSLSGTTAMARAEFMESLRNLGLERGRDWWLDNIDSAVYKGIQYSQSADEESDEESLVESILLASGKPSEKARRIEKRSKLMDYLQDQRQSITRIYLDRSLVQKAEPVLKKSKLQIESRGDSE